MTKENSILIFDIGKTNKKAIVFDSEFQVIHEESTTFSELVDEDNFPCDDIHGITKWIKETVERLILDEKLNINSINFSGYGASFVHLDDEMKLIAPIYNYLKPFSDELKSNFFSAYSPMEKILVETAGPFLGSLNSGLLLYAIKETKPDLYKKIKYSLHLPQYFPFVFTGQVFSDITSIGCHTMLWDFTKNEYHQWVREEGIDKKLAPIEKNDTVVEVEIRNKKLQIGVGIHDSSAALIPYTETEQEPFALISTGTWCITLNPFNQHPLTKSELGSASLCYIQHNGKQVKAAQLFAGHIHEEGIKKISAHFKTESAFYKKIKLDENKLNSENELKKNLIKEKTSLNFKESAFLSTDMTIFLDENEAYHYLMAEIVQQQTFSSSQVISNTEIKKICVDGGFGKNELYMKLLAKEFPSYHVVAASVPQASSIGAAMVMGKIRKII
ncbi:MAG: carbohydrate kinase [Chitinophagaceae bacterium]|nr:MAG: carbohydrate kinase [Chitinophagaceae bacterium]